MSLEAILEEIKKEKVVAEQDLDLVSPMVLYVKKGQVNSAKERLEKLYIDYKNQILRQSIFILVTGQDSETFASIANESFKCFTLDTETFYKEIANEISPQLYEGKNINSSVFDVVNNVLEDRMKNLDVMSYNFLTFDSKYSRMINSKPELVEVLKNAINDQVGGEVIGLDALEKVSKEAVNSDYKSKIVPILLYTKDEGLVSSISDDLRRVNPRVVRVSAGKVNNPDLNVLTNIKEVTEETVGKALKEIATNA